MTHNIILQPYQNSWASDYDLWIYELSQVLDLHDADTFAHMGSTAIPGVLAKPTIDILLGVTQIEAFPQKNILALERLGFDHVVVLEEEFPFRRYFQYCDDNQNHMVHLHVVTKHSHFWLQHLLFKKYLLKHAAVKQQYSMIKEQAITHAKTRDDYTAYKTAFVFECLRAAYGDKTLNPPLDDSDREATYQPQAYMTEIVDILYSSTQDLQWDIQQWERFGKGPVWKQDKATKVWRLG